MKNSIYLSGHLSLILATSIILLIPGLLNAQGYVPSTLNDFFLPGSQPLESGTFADPDLCDNCHGGFDFNSEPAFNWRGSMMAHAQRDPLYLACVAIANQDAPEVGDLCIRCHSPKGWLEGRSVPTDGSALTAADRESVLCHFCHKMIAPSQPGVNPYPDYTLYTTQPANNVSSTYTLDQDYLQNLTTIPETSANGMYVCDDLDHRRGPYFDPQANHDVPYSPFHRDAALCGTCHDVSNPVHQAVRDGNGNIIGYAPNDFDAPATNFSPYEMFPIERTYSEWLMSAYNTPDGISGTWFGGNKSSVATCQDCHMKDVTGKGCNKSYAPVRNDLPKHDLTGGNTFISTLLETLFPDEINAVAIDSGVFRARWMLQNAATMDLTVNQMGQTVSVKITNETGHKLPSGYPEGRRMWINLKAYNSLTAQSFESGYYNPSTGILDKSGTKIYEIEPGLSPGLATALGLDAGESFHFVLNDTIYSDNRIPPRGFTNANFTAIQSPPVGYTYADSVYWDETLYNIPFIPDSVDVKLYYQSTSKEYVEFLRDENTTNNAGQVMYDLWDQNGKSAPELMVGETWSGPSVPLDVKLDIKAFMEGPFNGTNMDTELNDQNSLPLIQPFNVAPWYYAGTETVPGIPSPDIVDWILVELRETAGDSSTAVTSARIARKACFIKADGTISEKDGFTLPTFDITITENLYIVLWHRNHLGIMSSVAVTRTGENYEYDFSSNENQVYGGSLGHKELASGIWGMIASDSDASGFIDDADKDPLWDSQAGTKGYLESDSNLDSEVNNQDKNDFWFPNLGSGSQVPD